MLSVFTRVFVLILMAVFLPNMLFAGEFEPHAGLHSWQIIGTVVVLALVFIALIKEAFPPDTILLIGAGFLMILGVVTPLEFAEGFFKQVIFILAFLFIVVRALEVNGVLYLILKYLTPRAKSYSIQLLTLMFPVGIISAFLNNTPIVMLLTPVLQKWSAQKKVFASKYLIPLSFAAILGGSCSLIGSSTNLVVNGLLEHRSGVSLSFFELGKVGGFVLVLGCLYMAFVGGKILPKRRDPREKVVENEQDVKEFVVEAGCPLIGKNIAESASTYFEGEMLLEIGRRGQVIYSPSPREIIEEGDSLVFMGDIEEMARLLSTEGLRSSQDPKFELAGFLPHLMEVVVTQESSLIGKSVKSLNFRKRFGGLVLAIYRKGQRVMGNVRDIPLHVGDTLMVLTPEVGELDDEESEGGLCYIKDRKQLTVFKKGKALFSLFVLIAMVVLATFGIPMVYASLGAALLLVVTRCISTVEIKRSVRWSLLVLIGSTFSLGLALEKTGLAGQFAGVVLPYIESSPQLLIGGVFLLVAIMTEVITNTAAVLLMFPIAANIAFLAGYDGASAMKAIAVTTAVAGSCSFNTPIGYQTNTIVYGPGGYRFFDYAKVGIPMTCMILLLCSFLVPILWPLH